jgi:branched-chain amino acid aminotransferase
VGTAAVISPVKCINILGTEYYPYTANDATMFKLKKQLNDIRKGRSSDKYNWNWFI